MRQKPAPILLLSLALLTVLSLTAALVVFLSGRMNADELPTTSLPIGEAPTALRLTVSETGVTAVTLKQVRDAGLPVDALSASTLALSRNGALVPFHVVGDGPEAALVFFGEAITDTLAAPNVYWLAPGAGLFMQEATAAPSASNGVAIGFKTAHWEENKVFLAQSEGSDLWLGQLIFPPSTLEVPLTGLSAAGGAATLTVRIWSNNQAPPNPDHHIEVSLNGVLLEDHFWDGIAEQTLVIDVPEGVLKETENVLTLNAPGDTGAAGEQLYLDWIQLRFPSRLDLSQGQHLFNSETGNVILPGLEPDGILLDITEPDAPILIAGTSPERHTRAFVSAGLDRRYAAANLTDVLAPQVGPVPLRTSLRASERGANYLAIVADMDGFAEALEPLTSYRRDQGLIVATITLSQVYDEFAYGQASATAIQSFIRYASENWDPSPHFVLLVGDATYDVNGYTNGRNQNLLPTHLVDTRFAGYVASDTWYSLLADDTLSPGLAIGRFPAQTPEQVATMVSKTISYETSTGAEWTGKALLVADDEDAFNRASDRLADQLLTASIASQRLYMTENDDADYNRDAIFGAMNEGVGILNYVGHGSIEVWGDEKVLSADDAGTLANRDRLPIFTTFTCLNGFFNHPQVDALAETLLWAPDGVVVASVAPSGRTTTNQQTPLADEFFGALLSGQALTLGEALQQAKIAAAEDANLRDVIHTFNLFGDPALRFQTPAPAR
jgi:hypothetical protein